MSSVDLAGALRGESHGTPSTSSGTERLPHPFPPLKPTKKGSQ